MKFSTKHILTFVLALTTLSAMAQKSRNYSVVTWASVSNTPSITVHFEDDGLATRHEIYRKDLGAQGWALVATLGGGGTGDLAFEDKNVVKGQSYEYFVYKTGNGGFAGRGYLNAGVDLPAMHSRGTVLLIIDKMASDSLPGELETLRMDLAGDGYRVVDYVVERTMGHVAIKAQIADMKNLYTDLNALYIFGHVAVPYSGKYCNDNIWTVPPDGHRAGVGDHCGAWAADVYYAVPEGTWTDEDTVFFGAARSWNKNASGDGKYDQITLPGKVEYQLGRVDLFDMPNFSKSEFELLKQYINKSHNYRYVVSKPFERALIDENFNPSTEAFAGNGYRNFGAMVGRDNIIEADLISTLKDSTFVWAYGTGPGSFNSAGGIGTTSNFATNQGAATFNFLFGSFFGDWDNKNAFLKAPLAVEKGGLTCGWAGRPWWHTHPMALNQTIGFCTKLVQNNNNPSDYWTGFFANNIHIALMGDPTLRMHMIAPPTSLTATPSVNKMKVDLKWTASAVTVEGYNIYVSTSPYGQYSKINGSVIKDTKFTHNATGNGTFYYMIRAQRLETTRSGSFQNLSQGVMIKVDNMVMSSVQDQMVLISDFTIFPNPGQGTIHLKYTNFGPTLIEVFDLQGKNVYLQQRTDFGEAVVPVDLGHLQPGMYLVHLNGLARRMVIQ